MDGTGADSYFYQNVYDISQSQHRIVRVSKGSNRKTLALKLFQFCNFNLKTQQRYILQKEVNFSQEELSCLVDSLRGFLRTFDKMSNCLQFPLTKPKVNIASREAKDNLFTHYYNNILDNPNRQNRFLSFRFRNNNSCNIFLEKFELHGNQFTPTEIVKPNDREIDHLYKNRYYAANKCELIESNNDV